MLCWISCDKRLSHGGRRQARPRFPTHGPMERNGSLDWVDLQGCVPAQGSQHQSAAPGLRVAQDRPPGLAGPPVFGPLIIGGAVVHFCTTRAETGKGQGGLFLLLFHLCYCCCCSQYALFVVCQVQGQSVLAEPPQLKLGLVVVSPKEPEFILHLFLQDSL